MFSFYDRNDEGRNRGDSPERWEKFFESIRANSPWMALSRAPEYQLMLPLLPKSGRILEAGCGPGYWTRFLASLGYKAEGLDFSAKLIDQLKLVCPEIPWHQGDIRSLSFPDGTFSMILCWGVVEHFEDGPEQALSELQRVLASSGSCFVSVPYLNRWRRLLLRGRNNRSDKRTVFNQNYFTAAEYRDFLHKAGFTGVRLVPIGRSLEVALPFLSHLKPKLLKRILNRVFVPMLPTEASSHMLLAIATKGTGSASGSADIREPTVA